MPEDLSREYQRARRASLAGASCMYLLTALVLINLGVIVFALLGTSSLDELPPLQQAVAPVGIALVAAAVSLLGEFLRHFGRDSSPFGRRQSRRLLAAGLLLVVKALLDTAFEPPLVRDAVAMGPARIFVTTQPGLDLKTVVMVVFLICLAMVVRYGDALKEDSDSIA